MPPIRRRSNMKDDLPISTLGESGDPGVPPKESIVTAPIVDSATTSPTFPSPGKSQPRKILRPDALHVTFLRLQIHSHKNSLPMPLPEDNPYPSISKFQRNICDLLSPCCELYAAPKIIRSHVCPSSTMLHHVYMWCGRLIDRSYPSCCSSLS